MEIQTGNCPPYSPTMGFASGSGRCIRFALLLWMGSLRFTTVASSTVILTLQPIVVMLGSFYFFRLHANRAMIIGMGIALAGSFAIGIGDLRLSGAALYGDMLSFLSVIAISMHMLLGKQLREHISAYVYNFGCLLLPRA